MSLYVKIEKKFRDFKLETEFETKGGVLGILGASGCGKSVTLKCVAGILTPDKGRIVLNGRTLFDSEKRIDLKPQKRNVGYLFQDYALFPNKTVEENIRCGMERKKREEAKKWVRLLRLEGLENKYPSQLSGGQKQRTALARMLAAEPELLLLDEPFSALDSHLKEQLQMEMSRLLETLKRDMLLVTHSRDEAYRLCPDLMIMDRGRRVCLGPSKELFSDPGFFQAARLTGCKNFTRIEKLDDFQIKALDWGVVLKTEAQVQEKHRYAGIRAHSLHREAQGKEDSCFPVFLEEIVESPFEMYVIFRCQREPSGSQWGRLWWKLSKEKWRKELKETLPEKLWVSARDVMLLEDGEE